MYSSAITFTLNGDVCVILTNKTNSINISGKLWTFFDSQPTLTASFQNAVQSIPLLEGSFNLKLKFGQVLRKSII